MTLTCATPSAAAQTALPPASDPDVQAGTATSVLAAAGLLLPHLESGRRIDAALLRSAMEAAFGTSDATGAWNWKTAYDACEAATVLFLRKYGNALFRKSGSPAAIRGPRRGPSDRPSNGSPANG